MTAIKKFWCRTLSLLLLVSATVSARTIDVTTTDDEDGINAAACSLREALKAAQTGLAYGGCPAGERNRSDRIQLQDATYMLTSTLRADSDVIIAGANTKRQDEVNPLTGRRPNRVRPTTIIQAPAGQRVFDTTGSTGGITLTDLVVDGASVAGDGAVIYAVASVALDNVVLRNGSATGAGANAGKGGAIFLAATGSSLIANDTMFIGNVATQGGGVVAMNCFENLADANHQVELTRVLIRNSSGGSGAGAIHMCGNTTLALKAVTFSNNVAHATHGVVSQVPSRSGTGSFSLQFVTAVNNSGAGPVFRVGTVSVSSIFNSVIAWNVGDACSVSSPLPLSISGDYNVFDDSSCSGLYGPNTTQNNNYPAMLFADELEGLADRGGLTDVYLPRAASIRLLDKGQELGFCTDSDQRGASRQSGTFCDIGAAERLAITAVDESAQSKLRSNRIAYVDVLANDTAGEGATLDQSSLLVGAVTATPEAPKPGQPVIPITGFCAKVDNPAPVLNRPLEILPDGRASVSGLALASVPVTVRFPDGTSQTVTSRVNGTFGPVLSAGSLRNSSAITAVVRVDRALLGAHDPGNESLPDTIIYDRDADPVTVYPQRSAQVLMIGSVNGVSGKVNCEYTVADTNSNVSAPGKVEVTIKNMAPRALKDEFVLPQGTASLLLDLLANDNDEDDGFYGLKADGSPNFPEYPIKIVDQPVLGRIEGDTMPCIDNTATNIVTCYKNPVRYVPFNSRSPFDDSFTYRIIDADGEDSSSVNVAIKSNARPEGEGGSAAPGLLLLLGLLGLRRLRRL